MPDPDLRRTTIPRPVLDDVNDASFDSFPASDPPSWSSMHIGPPRPGQALPRSTSPSGYGRDDSDYNRSRPQENREYGMRLLRLETVLAATDLEPTSDAALQTAAALAGSAGATLHVAHVSPSASADDVAVALRRANLADIDHRIHVATGEPAEVLSALSELVAADVIVMGRRRLNAQAPGDRRVGSTALALLTRTLAPCLVTSQRLRLPIQRALVAIDASEAARGALLVALSWCSALRNREERAIEPKLTALHVDAGADSSPGAKHMKRTIDHELQLLRRSGGDWAGVLVEGITLPGADPVHVVGNYVRENEPDLLVLGTRGLSVDNAMRLGSVSSALTEQLEVPVLLVPPAVWRDYVRDFDYL